jgi:peptide/nickel transport system substrate-binding protein
MQFRQRSHRRKLARLVATPLIAAVIVAACGGGSDDKSAETTAAPEGSSVETTEGGGAVETLPPDAVVETIAPEPEDETPVPGGTLRYGLEADVDGLNPTTSALSAPGLMMSNAVFDSLAAIDEAGNAVPYLAESFTPSEDFKSWTVKLRPGIKFHDGTDLTTEAVVKSFETQRADPLVGLAVKPFFPETGATEIIDDLTVVFNLADPNAYFPATVTGQLGYVPSPTWLDAALADPTLNQQPVGTGPFKFESRSEDSITRFVRNDDWWNGEVYLDAIEFVPVTDADTRLELLLNGELEALQTTNQASLADLRDEGSLQNLFDDTGEESFVMINSASPPFDDIRARQALTYATPRQNYIDLIGLGESRAADQRFTPESPNYNPDVVQEADQPEKAVELAAEVCAEKPELCTDGKINMEFQFSGPDVTQTRISEILDEGWSVAFNVTFDELNQQDHIQQTALGGFNVNTWRQFGADDPSADNVWLLCRTIGGISLNWPRFCDEERDALLLQAQAETDPAARAALYQQVSQSINEAYTYVFLTHTIWANSFVESVRGICDRTSPEGVKLDCATSGRTYFSTVWLSS